MKEIKIKTDGKVKLVQKIESLDDLGVLLKKTFGKKYDEKDEAYAKMAFSDVPSHQVMVLEGWRNLGEREYPLLNSYNKSQVL
jgi:hypothetical protein